jgi:rhodanese-related sulfurtransferase
MLFLFLVSSLRADTNAPSAKPAPVPAKKVDIDEAQKLIADGKVVILDVRTPGEFQAGHLAGAKNIDFHDKELREKLEKLDKNQPYLVHCAAGGRSGQCSKIMSELQFKTVYDMKGGLNAWVDAGKPVEKTPAPAPAKP